MSTGPQGPTQTAAAAEGRRSDGPRGAAPAAAFSRARRRLRRGRGHSKRRSAGGGRPRGFGALFAAGPPLAIATGDGPSLHLSEPESARAAWLSGGLSALAHAALLALLVLSAWMAPRVVDEIIPVRILKEAPPSEAEPAPVAPRVLAPRRPVTATPSVAPRAIPRTSVAQPAAVAPVVPTETVQMAQIDPARAPSQVVQQQVRSDVVRAVRSPTSNSASPVAIAPTAPVAISPSSVSILQPSQTGPVAVAPTQQVAVGAPQAFSSLGQANASDYAPSADVPTQAIAGTQPTSEFGVAAEFAIDTVDRIGSGGGTGGVGVSQGTARCLESTYTHRYYSEEVKPRVIARWLQDELPASAKPGDQIVLNFVLDASGSATTITVRSAPNDELGQSCVRAMRDASPFPALGGDLRCLAGKKLRATFKVPQAR